ncbi:hypothetical protein NHX12_022158, partial [Muraenolepis orangiensis]
LPLSRLSLSRLSLSRLSLSRLSLSRLSLSRLSLSRLSLSRLSLSRLSLSRLSLSRRSRMDDRGSSDGISTALPRSASAGQPLPVSLSRCASPELWSYWPGVSGFSSELWSYWPGVSGFSSELWSYWPGVSGFSSELWSYWPGVSGFSSELWSYWPGVSGFSSELWSYWPGVSGFSSELWSYWPGPQPPPSPPSASASSISSVSLSLLHLLRQPQPPPSPLIETSQGTMSFEAPCGPGPGERRVRKRHRALQVRFRDICAAQKERRHGPRSRSISSKETQRRWNAVPARRSIPNVTRSTGVQTSPHGDLRYKTFPRERRRGHTFKHTAVVETYREHNNGFLSDAQGAGEDTVGGAVGAAGAPARPPEGGKTAGRTRALLHRTDDSSTEDLLSGANFSDGPLSSDPPKDPISHPCSPRAREEPKYRGCGPRRSRSEGLPKEEGGGGGPSTNRRFANSGPDISQDTGSKGQGGWSSLGPGSPSGCKRQKGWHPNGQQAQTLPHGASCSGRSLDPGRTRHASASSKLQHAEDRSSREEGLALGRSRGPHLGASQPITPLSSAGDKDIKEQLQAMETLINSSQETIKVLLGVIQELEKGEALREGLTYRTGQDTAHCDTCRNSACIIY